MKAQEWVGRPVSLPPLFEGPLDLLLHLVKVNQIEIAEVEIGRITDEYLEVLRVMEELDLDVAGDFLVMAATLLQLKAESLLPREAAPGEEDEEVSRAELIRLLLEYRRFKEAAQDLEARAIERARLFFRETPAVPPPAETLAVDLQGLLDAFRGVLARVPREVAARYARVKVTVEGRIEALEAMLSAAPYVPFSEIFRGVETRDAVIATFLALLEMVKTGRAVARQAAAGGEIRIYPAAAAAGEAVA